MQGISLIFMQDSAKKRAAKMITDSKHLATVEQDTIVFTDIASSTDRLNKFGDGSARDILLEHDRLVRNQTKKYGGKELENFGDGFMLSFKSVPSAIKCATAIQREISALLQQVRVRIWIDTGEVIEHEGGQTFGQAVVNACRILSKCEGGQIFVSDMTKNLAAGSKFSFLGRKRIKIKDFDDSIDLFEVAWDK